MAGMVLATTLLEVAKSLDGIEEVPGMLESHPLILGMLQKMGGWPKGDHVPWCGAYMGFFASMLGLPVPEYPLVARQWLTVGRGVALKDARPGFDVVILWRGTPPQPGPDVVWKDPVKKIPYPGHVTLLDHGDEGPDKIPLFGGNQNDKACTLPYPKRRVLGVRRMYF